MLFASKLKSLTESKSELVRKVFLAAYRIFSSNKVIYAFRYRPHMNDEKYIIRMYKKQFGRIPDLVNPKNFNEKSNWRKLNDRQDRYTDMVDKYKLKEIVKRNCGDGHTIPLLGVWDMPDQIRYDELPTEFVLKANHAGGVIICKDKDTFDRAKAADELITTLGVDYYHISREWPYRNVKRKILCEQYMGENLTDYKNYCFDGKLIYTLVWKNKSREDGRKPKAYFCGMYDRDWVKTDMELDYPSIATM